MNSPIKLDLDVEWPDHTPVRGVGSSRLGGGLHEQKRGFSFVSVI